MPALRAAVWSALAAAGLAAEPRRHLLVDPDVVAATVGRTEVALGPVHKSPANPLLAEDRKWEASWKNTNPSVVYTDGVYHLWMTTNVVRPRPRPWHPTPRPTPPTHADGLCSVQVCPGAAPGVYRSCAHPTYNYTVPATAKRDGGLLYARSTDGCAPPPPPPSRTDHAGDLCAA